MKVNYFVGITLFLLISCSDNVDKTNKKYSIGISDVRSSLLSEDHVSEGFMVKKSNGSIEHIFRVDPSIKGDHAGNSSFIALRKSFDDGVTWQSYSKIHESEYDDRNLHGGLTDDDKTTVFFRRYDNDSTEDIKGINIGYFNIKDENTNLDFDWISTDLMGGPGTDSISYVPNRGYMMALNGHRDSNIELHFSDDGNSWSNTIESLYYEHLTDVKMNEGSFTYLKDGVIIGLIRNLSGSCYYQLISSDFGETWSDPKLSNICSTYNVVGPHAFFDIESDLFVVLATDRRRPYNEQGLRIYATDFNDLKSNEFNHNFIEKVPNSISTGLYFYGYPSSVKVKENEYLVVFTDNTYDNDKTEKANFYQFNIKIVEDEHIN